MVNIGTHAPLLRAPSCCYAQPPSTFRRAQGIEILHARRCLGVRDTGVEDPSSSELACEIRGAEACQGNIILGDDAYAPRGGEARLASMRTEKSEGRER